MVDSIKSQRNKAGTSNTEKPYAVCAPSKSQLRAQQFLLSLKRRLFSTGQKESVLEVWRRLSVTD